jgi:DHA1 family inner membrane transport protein
MSTASSPDLAPADDGGAPANDNGEGTDDDHRGGARLLTPPFVRLLVMQAAFGFAFSVFFLLPKVLAADFGATPSQIGLVMAAFGVASLLSIPIVGALDRVGHRRALVAANLLLAAGSLGFVLVHHAGAGAAFLRGVQGLAWSLGFAASLVVAADLAPAGKLAQAVGLVGASGLAMNALAPAVAEPVGERFGHAAVFVLATAAALVGALVARRLPAGAAPHAARAGGGEARAAKPSSGGDAAPYLVLAVAGLAFGVMFTFIAPFALARGIHAVRSFFAAYTVAALAVRLFSGRLSDRFGHRRAGGAAAIAYGLAVVAAGVVGPAPLAALGAAFGAAHGALFPSLMALVIEGAPGRGRTRALALANGSMNLGIAGVFGLGLVAGRTGYPAVFVAAGAVTILAALLLGGNRVVTARRRCGAPARTRARPWAGRAR